MRLLRAREVRERTGLGRMTLWRLEAAGEFPRRRQITPRSVRWIDEEIDDWIARRPPAPPPVSADVHGLAR